MTKQKFDFPESSFSFGAQTDHRQLFPEHMNQKYFNTKEEQDSAKEQKAGSSKEFKKEKIGMTIGTWAAARGQRY